MVDKEAGNVTSGRLTIHPITRCHITEEQNMNFPENFVLEQTFVNFMFFVRRLFLHLHIMQHMHSVLHYL